MVGITVFGDVGACLVLTAATEAKFMATRQLSHAAKIPGASRT